MPTTERKTRAPAKLWPYVRFSKRDNSWLVDTRTKDGGKRLFFRTKEDAETCATQARVERGNLGTSAFGNAELAQYGKTVQDAISFYVAHLRRQEKSISVTDAVTELVRLKQRAGKSERYCHDLELRLGRFAKSYGERSVASFDTKALDEWLAGMPVGPSTRNTFRRDLRTFFSFCEKRGYCSTNEAKKTEQAKVVSGPPGILTVAQTVALLNVCESDTLPFVAISLFAGLRAAEMEKLDWSEVDLEGGHIEVTAKKAKTARRRLIPISENLAAWIQPLAAQKGSVVPVGLRKRFDAVKERAGLTDWPPNAMRHSFASYRLAQCQDAARVSLEMGNSPAMVFAHYRELVREKDAKKFWAIMPSADTKKVIAFAAK
jgi:integrase